MNIASLEFPVVLIIGSTLSLYKNELALFEVAPIKSTLKNIADEGWLIIDSNGKSVYFNEVGLTPAQSWLKRLFGIKRITPVLPVITSLSVGDVRILIGQALIDQWGLDLDFENGPVPELLQEFEKARDAAAIIALIPFQLA